MKMSKIKNRICASFVILLFFAITNALALEKEELDPSEIEALAEENIPKTVDTIPEQDKAAFEKSEELNKEILQINIKQEKLFLEWYKKFPNMEEALKNKDFYAQSEKLKYLFNKSHYTPKEKIVEEIFSRLE